MKTVTILITQKPFIDSGKSRMESACLSGRPSLRSVLNHWIKKGVKCFCFIPMKLSAKDGQRAAAVLSDVRASHLDLDFHYAPYPKP